MIWTLDYKRLYALINQRERENRNRIKYVMTKSSLVNRPDASWNVIRATISPIRLKKFFSKSLTRPPDNAN